MKGREEIFDTTLSVVSFITVHKNNAMMYMILANISDTLLKHRQINVRSIFLVPLSVLIVQFNPNV